jgi:mRNA interferase RelE/StbE
MPKYVIVLTKKAQKQLDKIPDAVATSTFEAITTLEQDPRPQGCKKLTGREGYRIRVGNYRVIYSIIDDELIVSIITLGHRKDIYN